MQTLTRNADFEDLHLGALFFRRAAELGGRTFIRLQRGDRFDDISWREFAEQVRALMFGLYSAGMHKGDRIAIIGENSLEWLCADMATLAGGFTNIVASPSLSDRMLLKILAHSGCRAAFVENEAGARRLLRLQGELPSLIRIIAMGERAASLPLTVNFTELLSRGNRQTLACDAILGSTGPDDLATIMYTSGSTGEPKGVMRTHNNLLSNISSGGEIKLSQPDELTIVLLSLNHLFGRFGFLKSVATGRTTAIIEATELSLDLNVIGALAPTAIAIVPRVMERIWGALLDRGANRADWDELERLDQRKSAQGNLTVAESLRFNEMRARLKEAVQRALGGRIKYVTYGGAPMQPRIMHFFQLIGIPLLGSYGSTECGGVTLSGIGESKPGSLGKPFPNVELRLADDGEVLVRGPTVTPGYFNDPAATREAINADGWFHTGDFGALDAGGCLYIVGRKKDVFNCSDGSNIYPHHIEVFLESDPFVRQAILIGDRRAFIAALIVPDRTRIAAELGSSESALTDGEVEAALQSRVEQINLRLEEYEKVRRFAVIEGDFSAAVRATNIFQKVTIDRKAVDELYRKEISRIYSAEGRQA